MHINQITIISYDFDGSEYVTRTHVIYNIDSLWMYIDKLLAMHESNKAPAGMSVLLRDSLGDSLQVGFSAQGWLLIANPIVNTKIFRHTTDDETIVAFLLPEWTEFYMSCIHPPAKAKKFIDHWFETGEFSTEILQ